MPQATAQGDTLGKGSLLIEEEGLIDWDGLLDGQRPSSTSPDTGSFCCGSCWDCWACAC